MAQTSLTSSTSYLGVTNFLLMHDARKVGDLLLDTGAREASGSLATNTVLLYMLKRASAYVEAACLRAGRYTPSDLAALTGVGATLLEGLVGDLCIWMLTTRRHKTAVKLSDVTGATEAFEMLKQLASGERIFSFQEAADAGLSHTETESVSQKDDRGGIATIAERYFGRVARRRPI